MEGIALLIWILLAFVIPITLVVISLVKYKRQEVISKIVFRFILAVVAYILVSFVSLLYLAMFIGGIEPHLQKAPGLQEKLLCFVAVAIYGAGGFLLCSFVNGSFMKFNQIYKKPQSIFDNTNE